MSDFEERFEAYRKEAEEAVQNYCVDLCNDISYKPDVLRDSVIYALSGGGKRIRPVLCLAAGDMVGASDRNEIMPLALSIELIHNYSLIHDDIMDGDDYRRGKETVQKKFGTANALLAGDALLNDAHTMMLRHCESFPRDIHSCRLISSFAGVDGMIAGQSADILHEGDDKPDADDLDFIYNNKTAMLIMAACAAPTYLADEKIGTYFSCMLEYGRNIGKLFQLTDDLLDCASEGSDLKKGKCTAVSLYGPVGCEKLKKQYAKKALAAFDCLEADVSFFKDFVKYVEERKA